MLTVEDGTGVVGADSFASVAEADAFWDARGSQGMDWAALPTSTKEAALRDATDYASLALRSGTPLYEGQGLPWPWYGSAPRDRMTVAKATILAADVARLGPLLSRAAGGGRVLSESKTLGPLSKSTTYSDRDLPSSANGRDMSFIDDLLSTIGGARSGLLIGRSARA